MTRPQGPTRLLRRNGLSILHSSIKACDPLHAIRKRVKLRRQELSVGSKSYDLRLFKRVFVVGAGKASARMAQAMERILGDRITSGIVVTKTCHTLPLHGNIDLVEGGHPVPDREGLKGTGRIVRLLKGTSADDLVILLLSGGGSALLVSPVAGISLADMGRLTRELLRCGANIKEINAIRKHISRVKGGRLAEVAQPSPVLTLVLSDVIGDRLDSIASGPTAPDKTTFSDCMKIIKKYRLRNRIPKSTYSRLERGAGGRVEETPKPGDPIFRRVKNVIVGSNRIALKAAEEKAKALGFNTSVLPRPVAGDTTGAAKRHVRMLKDIVLGRGPVRPPACLISGGETTVEITGEGKGGRNQEFALVAAVGIEGMQNVVLLSAGTDGTDGPTDAAGAICDGDTVQRALTKGLDPRAYLAYNDSYHFFGKLGDLIITGPTQTNVMDIHLALIGE